METTETVSDQLERWLAGEDAKTLGSLIDVFGPGSFGLIFVVLMSPAALPLPTGGATHVLEAVTALLAVQLIVGRREIWLPARWKRVEFGGGSREKFITGLLKRIRWLERFSRPRWRWVFRRRVTGPAFGLATLGLTVTAFFAPPFSGLDTLPALGVVLMALGVLIEYFLLAVAGFVVGVVGIAVVLFLGNVVVDAVKDLF